MITKLIICSLLVTSCMSIGFPRHIRFFGSILNDALWKYRYIGSERALRLPNMAKENKVTFTFPEPTREDPDQDVIIHAIQQIDHSNHQAKVDIVSGGIGSNQVTMTVSVPQGAEIGSEFHFFGEKVPKLKEVEKMLLADQYVRTDLHNVDPEQPTERMELASGSA